MTIFWKASVLQMGENYIFYVKWRADDDGAMVKWLWLLFVELGAIFLPNFPSKFGLKKCFLTQQSECRCGPTATVTSLKNTSIEGPDQALQGKQFSSRIYAAYAT